MTDYPLDKRLDFIRDCCRDLKIMLDQMCLRPNTRSVANISECKLIVLLIDKTIEQHQRTGETADAMRRASFEAEAEALGIKLHQDVPYDRG